jgi:alpha-tubulin suppressor-like RCC1 family protein
MLFLILTALFPILLTTCKDDPVLPDAGDLVDPLLGKFAGEQDANAQRITLLITELYPNGGLENAALNRWNNIQRLAALGQVGAAESQGAALAEDVIRMMERDRLDVPTHPDLTGVTIEEAVVELVSRLPAAADPETPSFEESEDYGSGLIDPTSTDTIIVSTENEWAAVVVPPGASEETAVVSLTLLEPERCEEAGPLVQAMGCWNITAFPEDAFADGDGVKVEICVADNPDLTDEEWDLLQVHRKDEGGEVTALPWVDPSEIVCDGFMEEGAPAPTPDLGRTASAFRAVGKGLTGFLLPEPLAASFKWPSRPPKGLGGLTGSFSDFFGAISDYEDITLGSGPADTWLMEEPLAEVDLCTQADPLTCPGGSVTSVELSAQAVGSTDLVEPPWARVYFYRQPAGGEEPATLIGEATGLPVTDNGVNRFFTWTITLEGQGLPGGPMDVFAIGAREYEGPEEYGGAYRTPLNSNITGVPEGVEPEFVAATIGAGYDFSCALRSDGKAFCWGRNQYGQLGDGTQTMSTTPVAVSGGHTFEQLAVGDLTACGITADGSVYCWGSNARGQLGDGSPMDGLNNFSRVPVPVAGGHSFLNLDVGLIRTCGVAADGLTYCWGRNSRGALGNGTVDEDNLVPGPVIDSGELGFVTVSVGHYTTCALDAVGAVFCWGGDRGQFGNGTPDNLNHLSPIPAANGMRFATLMTGNRVVCGIDAESQAYCWGYTNTMGEQGNGSTVTQHVPTPVVGGHDFGSIFTHQMNRTYGFTCGINTLNRAWCWGANDYGQLGGPSAETCMVGTDGYDCSSTPVAVSGGRRFAALEKGWWHACGLSTDGNVYCWGRNHYGQLGDGSLDDSMTPVAVGDPSGTPGIGPIVVTPYATNLTLLGSTLQLEAVAMDLAGDPLDPQPTFTWSSADPTVAEVDATGLVTAWASGSAVINVSGSNGAEGRTTINVNIVDPVAAFRNAWAGGIPGGIVGLSGLLADEWMHSGTFPYLDDVDKRSISDDNSGVGSAFNQLQTARIALEWEVNEVLDSGDPQVSRMLMLTGYTYLAFAENWCSGVPLDDPDVGLSTADLIDLAKARFEDAISAASTSDFAMAARVGLARANRLLGEFTEAIFYADQVPNVFALNIDHADVSGEWNGIYYSNTQTRRITLADSEGDNGLPFRMLPNDPRVPWESSGTGFNGVTPQYNFTKYPTVAAPTPLATGTEARLIMAEERIEVGDWEGGFDYLKELRATVGLGELTDPATQAEAEEALYEERAFWLFATGQRLADLRFLVNYYGRDASSLFPVGTYPAPIGGVYGSDGNFPVPTSARGAGYSGCTVRGW